MSFLATWLEKLGNRRDALRRAGFAFLSLWVHAAVIYYLTMMLFTGHPVGTANAKADPVKPKHIVEINLAQPPTPPLPPQTETPPVLKFDPNALAQNQVAAPAPTPPPSASEQPKPDDKSIQTSSKDGMLDCDSLDKKPERIVLGPTYLNIPPQEDATGDVVLRMKIHHDGTVLGVKVENSTMTPRVQEKVMQWVSSSLFHPGEMGGVRVDCELRFEFSLGGPDKPDTAH